MLSQCAYSLFSNGEGGDYKYLEAEVLDDNCCVQDKEAMNEFYKYYQIRRNILYARENGDYVLFLTPRENMALDEGRAYIERYANERGTDCIRNIYWEDLLETTLHVVSCVPELFDYYTKFKEKYFG